MFSHFPILQNRSLFAPTLGLLLETNKFFSRAVFFFFFFKTQSTIDHTLEWGPKETKKQNNCLRQCLTSEAVNRAVQSTQAEKTRLLPWEKRAMKLTLSVSLPSVLNVTGSGNLDHTGGCQTQIPQSWQYIIHVFAQSVYLQTSSHLKPTQDVRISL